jgi:hypothetical protein
MPVAWKLIAHIACFAIHFFPSRFFSESDGRTRALRYAVKTLNIERINDSVSVSCPP